MADIAMTVPTLRPPSMSKNQTLPFHQILPVINFSFSIEIHALQENRIFQWIFAHRLGEIYIDDIPGKRKGGS